MMEKIKNLGSSAIGFAILTLFFLIISFMLDGVSWLIENYYDLFGIVNSWISALVIILVIFSVFPRIRAYTGNGIVFSTLIWGAIFWLFSLFITYQLWGIFGVIIGVLFFGLGVFVTAFLALIFDGQTSVALFMLLSLIIIYGIRMLGMWIIEKHKFKPILNDNL